MIDTHFTTKSHFTTKMCLLREWHAMQIMATYGNCTIVESDILVGRDEVVF